MMKNSTLKRLLSLFIVIVMLISGSSQMTVSASGGPPDGVQITDMYSPWAYWDIYMAQNVYNLGNEGTYSNFKGGFTWMKFTPVLGSIAAKFGIDMEWAEKEEYAFTRGETIEALYSIIIEVLELEEPAKAIDYFAFHELITGRSFKDYQLDKKCTTEEMIVFSVRVYDHIVHRLKLDSKGFFWKVTGESNTIYLLGSIHISDGSLYPLNPKIEAAFNGSEYLVLEITPDQSDEDMEYYMTKGMILDGSTIKDYIDPDVYELYEWVCQTLGMEKEVYDKLQPWMAESLLGYLAYAMTSEYDDIDSLLNNLEEMDLLGIESHFTQRAMNGEKIMIQLESARHQADFLSSFSPELQEFMLFWVLVDFYEFFTGESIFDDDFYEENERTTAVESLYNTLEIWKKGDEKALIKIIGLDVEWEHPIDIEYNYIMLTLRNIAMVEQILEFLNDDADYFIVVGAAHMFGKDGIVQLLIDEGYKVERVR